MAIGDLNLSSEEKLARKLEEKQAQKAREKRWPRPSRARRPGADTPVSPQSPVRSPDQPTARTAERSPIRMTRRAKVRYAFEFYQDQILKLKELRRDALLKDEDFSMSDVVRKALDKYLESLKG